MKEYKCEYYSVMVPERSCFFCQHCTDIFFDYTHGPYLLLCTANGLKGKCNLFKEDEE